MVDNKIINIIIADDSPVFIEALSFLFSKNQKYNIIDVCSNGLELVSSKNIYHADILLIDIEMPVMNGYQAATKINFNYSSLPMIALTMHSENVYLSEFIKAGFRGYIHKPDSYQNLFRVIDEVINNKMVFPKNIKITNNSN